MKTEGEIPVQDATNATPVVVTTKVPHSLEAGATVTITGVNGNDAANGDFTITDVQPTKFTLVGSAGDGVYAGGGIVTALQPVSLVHEAKIGTLNEFIKFLKNPAKVTPPIGNVLLGAHANEEGNIEMLLFRGQKPDQNKDLVSNYETLQEAARPLPSPPNPPDTPNPNKTIEIPDSLIGHNPGDPIRHSVHFKGCNIGKDEPFLTQWKFALGDRVHVTAPKHFHGVFEVGTAMGKDDYGSWEYMCYQFVIHRATRFPNRQALLTAFATFVHPQTNQKYQFIDRVIPAEQWTDWIPEDITKSNTKLLHCPLGTAQVGSRTTISAEFIFKVEQTKPFIWPIKYTKDTLPVPSQRRAKFKENLESDPDRPDKDGPSRFSGHVSPKYERLGYASLDELMDGYVWDFTKVGESGNRRTLKVRGSRFRYTLILPVTNPSPSPGDQPNEHPLLVNYHPNPKSNQGRTRNISEDDSRLFAEV